MTHDERMMILQMVADKKISAAEGAELLRLLDSKEAGRAEEPGAADQRDRGGARDGGARGRFDGEDEGSGFGLGNLIDRLVNGIVETFSDGPRYEFPFQVTGTFSGEEIPIRIATGNGRLEVRTWDQPGYQADILVKARGPSEEAARRLAEEAYKVQADERGFELVARQPTMGDLAVNVTLLVPQDKRYRLDGRTGNGRVTLENLTLSEGRLTTGNGRVTVTAGQGDRLVAKTGNGRITVESDIADLSVETGNGSVQLNLTGARSQQIRAGTGNGSVRVDSSSLPAEVGFRVEASTGMGGIRLERSGMVHDRDVRTMGNKHLIARTQGYEEAAVKVDVRARTGLGSITIE